MRLYHSLTLICFLVSTVNVTACTEPCEDDYEPSYTVNLVVNPRTLDMAQGDSASVTTLVLDQCSHPHTGGEQILFQARTSSDVTGRFQTTGEGRVVTFLDTSGGARATFECSEVAEQVLIIAQLSSGPSGRGVLECIDTTPDEE